MVTKGDKIAFLCVLLCIAGLIFFYRQQGTTAVPNSRVQAASFLPVGKKDHQKDKKKGKEERNSDAAVTITRKWEMPASLKEISGITFMPDGRIACVQDELGKIFVFNTRIGKVDHEIAFGPAGDYEGIAVKDRTAYVLRADGRIFEVSDFQGSRPAVQEYNTPLTASHDVEGLCYDARNDRLLLAVKATDPNSDAYKGIYPFDLQRKQLAAEPAYKIMLTERTAGKVKKHNVQPSGIIVHPETDDLYVVDGPKSRLLVFGQDGTEKESYQLDKDECPQPEGIAFTPTGDLFISNEGRQGAGNILQLSLADQQ